MEQQERAALERLAERGSPAGANAVVAAAVAEVGRSRRRPARVAVGAFAAAAMVAAVVAASTFAYVRVKLGDVERIDLSADLAGSADVSGPMTVLLVGSDSRAGLDAEDRERFGGPEQVAAARADTIMVLRVDPEAGTAAVLSLPRDLWLPIDGAGAEQRINTALAGGPGVLVRTVQSALGIELDHYVQIDFDGFRRIVDAVGGVTVRVDVPLRDRVTGLDLPDVGCRELSGEQALALVRSRSLERQEEGRWRSDPTGDLGRIERQRQFLLAMLADVGESRSPVTLARLLEVAADEVAVDDALGAGELLELGRRVGSYVGSDVRFVDVPVVAARIGSASVLRATPEALLAAGSSLLSPPVAGAPVPPAPSSPSTALPPCG